VQSRQTVQFALKRNGNLLFDLFSGKTWNSQAQADTAIDDLRHRQSQLSRQKTSSDVAKEIALARLAIEQAVARYHSAMQSRRLVEELLKGEETKWLAGTSTLAAVVSSRRELADAQSRELASAALLVHSRIALDQALGLTLERNDIKIDDVRRGAPGEQVVIVASTHRGHAGSTNMIRVHRLGVE